MYSVAIKETDHNQVYTHLIRRDRQEDLCFGLYQISTSPGRKTAVINQIIYPEQGDRNIHGNVSFTSQFFDRVISLALKQQCGICFMHSHLTNGWQDMSDDDIDAEQNMAPRIKAVTGLPLVGLTLSRDHFWSARFWSKTAARTYSRFDCGDVRVVGKAFRVSHYDKFYPSLIWDEAFTRTISAWGQQKQTSVARLKVGIVGLGSVGSIVAEALIKTGVRHLTLIDFDTVKRKNLDRLNGIGNAQIGQLKVNAIKTYLLSIASNTDDLTIEVVPYSIAEKTAGDEALGCDILFSCVDRPWPRMILNSISFANYIPIIDGGIDCSINKKGDNLAQARWKTHTVSPNRRCLCCLGQYTPEDVALEQSGLLEDPHYIGALPPDHFIHRGENVYAFSLGLAGMEMQQFLSLLLQPNGQYVGPKEYNFNSGTIDSDFEFECRPGCAFNNKYMGQGDNMNKYLFTGHEVAAASRNAPQEFSPRPTSRFGAIQLWIKNTIGKIKF